MPQYQTYFGVHLDHHSEQWGGQSFNKILVLEYPDPNLVCTSATDATGTVELKFLYPLLVQNKYFLDGIVDGHVTFKADATAGRVASGYTISLNKLNNSGTITNIASMTYTFGTVYTFTANQYLTVPIFFQVSKQPVNENEKLYLSITLTTGYTAGTNYIYLSHANDSNVPDIKIRLPYAPTG